MSVDEMARRDIKKTRSEALRAYDRVTALEKRLEALEALRRASEATY